MSEAIQTPPPRRPRVLLIAEAANPEWVSVPLIGWSQAQCLREVADVHFVTQVRNKDDIERAGLTEGRDFTAIDSEALARPLWAIGKALRMGEGKGWTALQAINAASYPYFERLVWRQFGEEIETGRFDIVHRVTPLSPTISSPVAARCARAGVPFVLGPLNGGVPWPRQFDSARRQEREWLSYLRGAYKALPGRGRTLRHAAAVIAGSRHTASEIPDYAADKLIYLPENAVDPTRFPPREQEPDGVLKACFIGRMVPYKGPDMLLEAAAPLLRNGQMQLEMIGDGPMLQALMAQAEALGIGQGLTFHGWLAHEEVGQVARGCHLLAFPSIREFGGGVVLEAMAMGLAPLIVDYAGPAELVTEGTGWKIPLGSREEIVSGFAEALELLASNPGAITGVGQAARARVEAHFTWAAKARQIGEIYDWVLGNRPEKPQFQGLESGE